MRLIFLTLALVSLIFFPVYSEPEEVFLPQSKISEVPLGAVVPGDFFSVADAVSILGTVQGDAYLIGSQVVIEGLIEGDLLVFGGSVIITGTVAGNVKIVAGQATIEGVIGKKLLYLGVNIQMPESGQVKDNVMLIAGNADFDSSVDGNMTALVSSFKVGGTIKQNLRTFVGWLRLTDHAHIIGHMRYRSNNEASIDPQAKIEGGVVYRPSLFRDIEDMPGLSGLAIGSKIAAFLMNFFYTFVVGLLLIRYFPVKLRRMLRSLQRRTWKSFLWGLVVLIVVPLVAVLLLITVVGTPFALTLMALNVVSFYTIKVFPILWVSNFLFSYIGWKPNTVKVLTCGQILYYLITMIPFIGWGVISLCTVLGLGAAVVSQINYSRVKA